MKTTLQSIMTLMIIVSITSCGLPTALVRTYKNSLEEITEISNGTSSAYQDVR